VQALVIMAAAGEITDVLLLAAAAAALVELELVALEI